MTTVPLVDLDDPRTIHLVGIGGAGMSGLARILLQRGHAVSGSDLQDSRVLDELRGMGARIVVGHDPTVVATADALVASTAVSRDDPEVASARVAGLPVLRRAELLASLMVGSTRVLIAGTHGKTTTTSMTVVALQSAGLDPSFAIGGQLNETGTNAHAGTDPIFVAEADESDRSFLAYQPDVVVVTNLELDHPDEFTDLAAVTGAFEDFLARRPDGAPVIVCLDDPGAAALAARVAPPVVTYGADPSADLRLVTGPDGSGTVRRGGADVAEVVLAVPGRHNLLNAVAALAVCDHLGVDVARAARGLASFRGAARRFQVLGEAGGVTVVDDYAHHPTELRVTLSAARSGGPSRVVLVVQPHRFSRTAVLGEELGRAAAAADLVVVTEVYGAGEQPQPGVNGRLVADAAEAAGASVLHEPHLGAVAARLATLVRPGDLVLVTGAGDVTQVGPALLARLGSDRV